MERTTKNGKFFTLIKLERLRPKDSMKNSDSTSIDHSTLYLSFHSIELLKVQVQTTLSSRGGERTGSDSNSTSKKSQRPFDHNNGRTMLSKSKAMVEAATSD
jgi:hypothetical protein